MFNLLLQPEVLCLFGLCLLSSDRQSVNRSVKSYWGWNKGPKRPHNQYFNSNQSNNLKGKYMFPETYSDHPWLQKKGHKSMSRGSGKNTCKTRTSWKLPVFLSTRNRQVSAGCFISAAHTPSATELCQHRQVSIHILVLVFHPLLWQVLLKGQAEDGICLLQVVWKQRSWVRDG